MQSSLGGYFVVSATHRTGCRRIHPFLAPAARCCACVTVDSPDNLYTTSRLEPPLTNIPIKPKNNHDCTKTLRNEWIQKLHYHIFKRFFLSVLLEDLDII
eukprot:6477901-Amphidinium_carterae.1